MAAYLLSRGATLTPHAAARLGMIDELRAMITADPSAVHARGGDGQMPLHFACTVEIADLLLAHGAEIDALDIDHGSTPAQWRSESCPTVAGRLVSLGAAADPFLAVRIGDVGLLEKLLAAEALGAQVRVSRGRFPVPPPAAGHIYLFTIGDGATLMHTAAGTNHPALVPWLAANGADPNARGGYDNATPLHVAAWGDRPDMICALLDAGANIDARSGHLHNNEPIGWAIVSGAVGALRVLLQRGATVRPIHREDAMAGVSGRFRDLNPQRSIDAWRDIADVLSAS
jgi:ankyrin repeat protein